MSHKSGSSSLSRTSEIVDVEKRDSDTDGGSSEFFIFFLLNDFLFLGKNGQNFHVGLREPNITRQSRRKM